MSREEIDRLLEQGYRSVILLRIAELEFGHLVGFIGLDGDFVPLPADEPIVCQAFKSNDVPEIDFDGVIKTLQTGKRGQGSRTILMANNVISKAFCHLSVSNPQHTIHYLGQDIEVWRTCLRGLHLTAEVALGFYPGEDVRSVVWCLLQQRDFGWGAFIKGETGRTRKTVSDLHRDLSKY